MKELSFMESKLTMNTYIYFCMITKQHKLIKEN